MRTWRLTDGAPLGNALSGHHGQVWGVAAAVLPDGTPVIISGGAHATLRVWRLADGSLLNEWPSHGEYITGAIATGALADGTAVLVIGQRDGAVRILRLPDGASLGLTDSAPLGKPRKDRDHYAVLAVAVSVLSDGTRVAASVGLVIEDASPAWSSDLGAPPAWCDALVQVPGWAQPLRVYSVDLPWRSSVEQRSQAERLAARIAELTGAGEPAIAGGNWNSYSRADPVMSAELEAAPLHLRPSRMRYSAQDRTLTPNYDVHDVLACVGMEDAIGSTSAPGDPGETDPRGRVDRIYLTRDLVRAATRYVQQDLRDSEHRALMVTLNGAAIAGATR